ncbi:ER membrane protein complex subunit 9 isoform X2 [Chlorocebus sabaeus]|uniref:ER membrane protein complex subunit 9 isoform X2 n=1 Tax=Chlorocebus sabaeus TaxID=60711 RepID=UPI0018B02594|nr:ER membrane protein complex subunit 9 isoform X2 [Chlorocebus sabaeus]
MLPGTHTPQSTGCFWRQRRGPENACASPTVCPSSTATWPCPSCWRSPSTRWMCGEHRPVWWWLVTTMPMQLWTTRVSEHLFPTALKHQAVVHQASSRPDPRRPPTGKGHSCAHIYETWEAQLKWMGFAHSWLLTPLIFPLHSPGPLALKIAGRIAEFFPDAVLIMLDNQKLVPQPRVPPVIVLENQGLRWVPKDKNLVMWRDWEESRQMVGALLEDRAHQHLVDFDCHLDDIRQDWTNQRLNTQITQWVGPTNGNGNA